MSTNTSPLKIGSFNISPRMFSLISLIVAMICIQSGASIAKELFLVWGVLVTTAVRTSCGFLLLSIFWFPRWQTLKSAWKPVLLYGISLGAMNLTFYQALSRIPLGLAVALEFIGPLGLSLISSKKPLDILWAGLAGVGVLILLMPGINEAVKGDSLASSHEVLGVLFALAAAIAWALYIVFGKQLGKSVQGGQAASLGMLGAALFTLPFGLTQTHLFLEHMDYFLWGVFLALFSSAIPYALEMLALRHIPTKTFGILMALEPVVASIVGFVLLRESLSMMQTVAVLLITLAGQGSLWKK